jgi:hypothetical protein
MTKRERTAHSLCPKIGRCGSVAFILAFFALGVVIALPADQVRQPRGQSANELPAPTGDFDGTLVVQAPVRPDAASKHENGSRPEPTGSRVIKGEVRLDAIRHQIRGAILTITLSKTEGPIFDARAERLAQLRFFNISRRDSDKRVYVPFTIGDFTPRVGAHYMLMADLDMNANGERDAGDYVSERRVEVLARDSPDLARLEDFAVIPESR